MNAIEKQSVLGKLSGFGTTNSVDTDQIGVVFFVGYRQRSWPRCAFELTLFVFTGLARTAFHVRVKSVIHSGISSK
jgi:hypothetical protein